VFGGGFGSKLTGQWTTGLKILEDTISKWDQAQDQALREEAHFLAKQIIQGITSGAPGGKAFKPLSPTTLAIRRFKGMKGSKPLMNRGDLRNSISVKKSGDGYFVGILRSAKGPGGAKVANIAEMNEFGSKPIVIQITPKMRRFLMAAFRAAGLGQSQSGAGGAGGGGGVGIIVVQIPPRPFFRPVFEKYASNPNQVAERFLGRLAKRLGGQLGKL